MTSSLQERFQALLLQYSQAEDPALRKQLEAALWAEYGQERALFVLDMSGFSRLTRKYGIVHYLSMVRRMQLTSEPIVRSFNGSLIKYEADNCFAVFPAPLQAVQAAIALQHAFDAANLLTADDLDIRIACGIDYGRVLIVGGTDCFGDAVNRASKLGEDLAEAGDILVTAEAMAQVPVEAGIRSRAVNLSISGIAIEAHAIDYRAA